VEDIVFIHSVDCRACAFELDNSSRGAVERIVNDRLKLAKCKNCERLREIILRQSKK
jgi:flavoprotein